MKEQLEDDSIASPTNALKWVPWLGGALRVMTHASGVVRTVFTAFVAPEQIRAAKEVGVVRDAVAVAKEVQRERREELEWKRSIYQSMGLSKEEIRAKLLPEIENMTGPLPVLRNLPCAPLLNDRRAPAPKEPPRWGGSGTDNGAGT